MTPVQWISSQALVDKGKAPDSLEEGKPDVDTPVVNMDKKLERKKVAMDTSDMVEVRIPSEVTDTSEEVDT